MFPVKVYMYLAFFLLLLIDHCMQNNLHSIMHKFVVNKNLVQNKTFYELYTVKPAFHGPPEEGTPPTLGHFCLAWISFQL